MRPASDSSGLRDRRVPPRRDSSHLIDGHPRAKRSEPPTRSYPFLHPPVEPDEVGRLGGYRVLSLLGHGGMAYVFLAEDIALQRRVALKVMKPDLDADMSGWPRFLREARIMAAVKHEHLVPVYQASEENGVIYLAMELLRGETLESRLSRHGPMSVPEALRLAHEIASGLAVIHQHGLIHRDIKPGNLWLESPADHVRILDFGLARFVNDDVNMTQSGAAVGTPAFMSPEQARGERLGPRSDLFSLGCVLYCLGTGVQPFWGENTLATLTALAIDHPAPMDEVNPDIPPAFADLVDRLLAKNPDDRPESAEAVIEELLAIAEHPHERRPTRRRLARHGVVAACVAAVLVPVVVGGVALAVLDPFAVTSEPTARVAVADTTYLSDLQPIDARGWISQPPGPPGPDGKRGPAPPFSGVRSGGVRYQHGLFMHPPFGAEGGVTRLDYRLSKQFSEFVAEVSLNDGPPECFTPLTFAVYGDGRLLWKSGPVRTQADRQTCRQAIAGVEVLTVEVNCPGGSRGAHAVWIEPHVKK